VEIERSHFLNKVLLETVADFVVDPAHGDLSRVVVHCKPIDYVFDRTGVKHVASCAFVQHVVDLLNNVERSNHSTGTLVGGCSDAPVGILHSPPLPPQKRDI
jgi:hypothetical protein